MNTLELPLKLPCPADLSPGARAAEITAILAAAIVRTLAADPARSPERRDSALASCPTSAFMQPRIKTRG